MSTETSKNLIKSPFSVSNNNQRNQDIFRNNSNNNSSIRSSRSSYSSSYSYTISSSPISSRPISQDLIIESGALGVFATSHYFKQQEFENHLNKKLNNSNNNFSQYHSYNYTSPIKRNRQYPEQQQQKHLQNIYIGSPVKLDFHIHNNNNMSSTSTAVNLTPLPPMEINSIPPLNLNEQIISSVTKNKKKVTNVDVLFKVFDLLAGKDKLGKVIQYGLRILMYYVINLKNSNYLRNLENESVLRYNNNNKGLNIILNLINNSKFFLLILLNQFEKRSTGLISALSVYRQLLRAGKTPLKVIRLFNKSKFTLSKLINNSYKQKDSNILTSSINTISKDWINESTFNDLTSLYYSWFDESLLAYKLGILSNPKYRKISSDHEAIAWYILIINGLRKEYNKLNQLNIKENQIKINYQVKKRAKALMYSMQNSNGNSSGNLVLQSPISSPSKLNNYYQYQSPSIRSKSPNGQSVISNTNGNNNIDKELEEIYKEKYMVQLELFKLSCDFIFDTISVFDIKVSQPFHLIFGFGAGFTSLSKIWMDVKENLEKE